LFTETELDKRICRYYTKGIKPGQSVYDLFRWKTVNVRLTNHATGDVFVDMEGLEFPEDYSQSACDIIASKFFRKKGVPNDRGCEYSMRQPVHRMVNFWIAALHDEGVVAAAQKQIIYDELAYMMLAQIWAPNSPQFFNTGLKLTYGTPGTPQGHYYYDEESKRVVPSADAYTRTQGSACFILT